MFQYCKHGHGHEWRRCEICKERDRIAEAMAKIVSVPGLNSQGHKLEECHKLAQEIADELELFFIHDSKKQAHIWTYTQKGREGQQLINRCFNLGQCCQMLWMLNSVWSHEKGCWVIAPGGVSMYSRKMSELGDNDWTCKPEEWTPIGAIELTDPCHPHNLAMAHTALLAAIKRRKDELCKKEKEG